MECWFPGACRWHEWIFRHALENGYLMNEEQEDKNMCVGLAAKVVGIKNGMAVVDASGAKREVSAELLEDLEPGDYVMVHAGIAIAKITEADDD